MGARRRPEVRWPEAGEAEAGGQRRNVREQVVQDRLGSRQEGGRGYLAGQEGPGLRPEYRIPRVDRPWRREGAPRGASLSYEGYIITAPRSLAEETALQNLIALPVHFRRDNTGE